MQLSETVKLYPTKYQRTLITEVMNEYIDTVNSLVSLDVNGFSIAKLTTGGVSANLPSAIINQCIRDAKSIVRKYAKACKKASFRNERLKAKGLEKEVREPKLPTLRKPCCYINNQNFKIKDASVEFPVLVCGKSKRIAVSVKLTERQKMLFSGAKLGTMRIVVKGHNLVAQIVYEIAEPALKETGTVMGVDLGIKCPAVSYCSDGSVKFYGNGRKNKHMRRHYVSLRKNLQKSKKIKAVKRINDKEQRIMRDIDHKISHEIVETAKKHNVSVIKLERLENIRSTTRKSRKNSRSKKRKAKDRKNNSSLHSWSFYRLASFIEYKAKLSGISVEYVNPAYTSQTCPVCGTLNHANDRNYVCDCGFHIHRDLLGAMNIKNSTEFVGNRQTA